MTRRFQTRAVHAPKSPAVDQQPGSVPIYQTSTFRFDSNEAFAEAISFRQPGYVYTRGYGNPTVAAFQSVMADLEGTETAVGFASGSAAIHGVIVTLVSAGQRIVAGRALYGGTVGLMRNVLPRFGIEVTFVDPNDLGEVRSAIPGAALFYCETIVNPTTTITDLRAVAEICREEGVPSVVDNTLASPYLCRPVELGVDVVVHSTTKYIGGHSDLIGGVACLSDGGMPALRDTLIEIGGSMQPIEAWLCIRGLSTLSLRMEHHCRSAGRLASFLAGHPQVAAVHYPGLPDHPQHELASRQLDGFGGTLAFEVRGGLEAGSRVAESLELGWIAASLGGVHTLVAHPATTTHRQLDPDVRHQAGIADGLLRVAVGLEDPDDLIEDFEQALG